MKAAYITFVSPALLPIPAERISSCRSPRFPSHLYSLEPLLPQVTSISSHAQYTLPPNNAGSVILQKP